jgi:Domain of unknown function (DUF4129)
MTGKPEPPWNWLHNVGIAAALAAAEATWVSLSLSAAANSSRSFRMDVPFLALAVPAVAAATVVGTSRRLRWRWWWRVLALSPVLVCGVGLTAGLVSELSIPGSLGAVSLHPWTVVGRVPSATAALAWFVAVLAWGRGTWLGAAPITFLHTARSVAISVVAYLILFAVLATNHEPTLRAATRGSGWLFIAFFAASVTTLALVRERDLEKQALLVPSSRPSLAWLTVLGIPLAAVAGLALLLAAIVGPLAPIIGRAVARVAGAIWSAIASVARAIGRLLPRGHPTRPSTRVRRPAIHPTPTAVPRPAHVAIHGPALGWEIFTVVVVLAGLVLLVRAIHPLRLRWRPERVALEEERDSVFSWGHLLAQLWALCGRLFGRRRPPVPASATAAATEAVPLPDLSEVRRQYRRVLVATNSVGLGRRSSETTQDFEQRLGASVLPPPERGDLDRLTRLYDRARYGGDEGTGEDVLLATHETDVVIEAIERLGGRT